MFQICPTLRLALLPGGILLALLPALTGCGTKAMTTAKAQDALSEALRHAQVDPNDKQARQWADRAVANAPNDPATYLGDTEPDPTGLLLSVAAVFARVGDDPALADYMQQAVQKFPDDYRGYQILIDTEGRLGRATEQKANAAKLVPLLTKKLHTPGTTKATNVQELTLALAQAYWDAGDAVNGAATYQSAISAYPADPGAFNNLAYAYAEANTNLPEALKDANQALKLAGSKGLTEEETAIYQDTLGWVQFRQGNFAQAQQNLEQAANTLPREAELRYHLGMVYAAEGKTDAAHAELGHAVLLSQGYAAAQEALEKLPKPVTTATR